MDACLAERDRARGGDRLTLRPRRAVVADAEARPTGSRRLLYSLRPIPGRQRGVSPGGRSDPPRSIGEFAPAFERAVAAAARGRRGVGLAPPEGAFGIPRSV